MRKRLRLPLCSETYPAPHCFLFENSPTNLLHVRVVLEIEGARVDCLSPQQKLVPRSLPFDLYDVELVTDSWK